MRTIRFALFLCTLALAISVAAWGGVAARGLGNPSSSASSALSQPAYPAVAGARPVPLDFVHDCMPLISKLGCNAAACHGSPKGKGGFNLSMFGADPPADHEALTKADGGRRVNRVEPLSSLFLLKATATIPHGGKQRMQVGSPQYAMLAAWVAQGAVLSCQNRPALLSLQAAPGERVLPKGDTQRLTATAIYADGSKKDVTGNALFISSDAGVCGVDDGGRVTAGNYGQAVIIVRYLRQPATVRIVVPQPLPGPFPQVPTNNKIDELVDAKLRVLGLPPAELCSDHEFLRRAYLDVTGTLPSVDEARAYLADQDPQKRARLVDRLLASEEFADYWAMKWGDLFRMKSEFPNTLWPNAVQAYHRWVRVSIANNKPYDQFVRELLTASGSNFRVPPANYFRAFLKKDPQNVAEVTALTFMGARIGCARCHGHPTENWATEDNLGLAAFFAQIKYKSTMEWKEEIVYVDAKQPLRHPRTGEIIKPKFPGGERVELEPGQDARAKFADWLTSPQNPWFARNIVNRIWFWLLGRGIVHEPDDLRPSNPPENPQLLDLLAAELVSHKFDLKHIYRLILNSRTYQLSAHTNEWNRNDVAHFSHYYVKRLGAETLLDAIGQVTGKWDTYSSIIPEPFVVLPPGFRATHLSDGSVGLPFLELFGRPPRDTAYESERDLDLYLRQTLHLLNSSDVQNKITASPRLAQLIKDLPDDAKIVEELYLAALSRPPTTEESGKIAAYLTGPEYVLPAGVLADRKAAEEALATFRADASKARADLDALTRQSKEIDAMILKIKSTLAKIAAQKTAAVKLAAAIPAAPKPAANTSPKTEAEKAAVEKAAQKRAADNLVAEIAAVEKASREKLAAAEKTIADQRKRLAAAKTIVTKLPAAEKAANARLANAAKQVAAAEVAVRQRKTQALQDLLWALFNTKEFVFNH